MPEIEYVPIVDANIHGHSDRRMRRIPLPPCPTCGGEHTRAVTRTDYVVYFRCAACLDVWSVPKPWPRPSS